MTSFNKTPITGGSRRQDVLAPLRMAEIVIQKPKLPAEIMSLIIDRLAIPDLMRAARVSKQMHEMVYEDPRWIRMLQKMGCWNEAEARRRAGAGREKALEVQHINGEPFVGQTDHSYGGTPKPPRPVTTIFESGWKEEEREMQTADLKKPRPHSLNDGFTAVNVSSNLMSQEKSVLASSLHVLKSVQSIRGCARQQYGKIYKTLAPFYFDIVHSSSEPLIFGLYKDPHDQAQMLAQLLSFCKSDYSEGWKQREDRLNIVVTAFQKAALKELDHAHKAADYDGLVRKYTNVLVTLNGGRAAIDFFLKESPLFIEQYKLGNPRDCINEASPGNPSLENSLTFFKRVAGLFNEQVTIIERVFPPSIEIMKPVLERLSSEVLSKYIHPLFNGAHSSNMETYLKIVSGVYEQSLMFEKSLQHGPMPADEFHTFVSNLINKIFSSHIDLYLREEIDFFQKKSDAEIDKWDKQLSERVASTESFFMSNVNRQADKRDFLSSFKKVVMMPISVLPSFTVAKPNNRKTLANGEALMKTRSYTSLPPSRSSTPISVTNAPVSLSHRASTPVIMEAPTTELAAKAAIMNARLEGISSLFSIEIALNLVHTAKASLERIAPFVKMGGEVEKDAQQQCGTIFSLLLEILGTRHIKVGFDKAVDHLTNYNPRAVSQDGRPSVAPLTTFLELVNVGDLIQQMIDVFFEQELVAPNLVDRNDFLDPSVREKKRFEQMLDERVAAGLNKGIDVLMTEVEYVCATTQASTDFNPGATAEITIESVDIGPTITAKRIVELVSSHTKMLVGSTDKQMLDVFNQEVGLRLFTALCKHLKRQRISVEGSIKLISDMNHYFQFIQTLKNQDLLQYFKALRELSQIYLIDPSDAKEMATIIADQDRFEGIFRTEEVYEFAERRADWYQVGKAVEKYMYGMECIMM
ncbi:MAG: F-box protein: endocytic membrane traffic, recycling ReCYcling 1 [Cirrosporium novae-zelandiae]|nr:MAG: F-box protein: endocytic membrane traffic, recycling ReCYcling 1 [Cirrosporium novae-zelandiae]